MRHVLCLQSIMHVSKFSLLFVSIHLPWEIIAFPQQRMQNSPLFSAGRGATYQESIIRPQKDVINRERAGKCTKTYRLSNS